MPLKKLTILSQDFVQRLSSERYIDDSEVFAYRRELQYVDKDSAEGASIWALYHACRKETDKALQYFRKSIPLLNINFIGNYFVFLKKHGLVNEYVSAASKLAEKFDRHPTLLGDKNLLKEMFQSAFWLGDIDQMSFYSQRIVNIGDESEKIAHTRLQQDLKQFLKRSLLSYDDFKCLMSLFGKFIDSNNVPYVSTGLFCDSRENLNYIYTVIGIDDIASVRALHFDFSCEIARQRVFDEKIFIADIVYGVKDMDKVLNVDITYDDGYYTAECSAINLVTESDSLSELHKFICDLTPDLIELNEINMNPDEVLFNYHFSQSAKESIRGH